MKGGYFGDVTPAEKYKFVQGFCDKKYGKGQTIAEGMDPATNNGQDFRCNPDAVAQSEKIPTTWIIGGALLVILLARSGN